MTRTRKEWKKGAQRNIQETIDNIQTDSEDINIDIFELINNIDSLIYQDEVNINEVEENIRSLKELLLEFAEQRYEHANEVAKLLSGSTLETLEGREPTGYSTPDGGAKHDAYYGMQAMNRNFAYHIGWRLNLNEWDKELGSQSHPNEEIEPVTASGTKKYTTEAGGRIVHLVIDERGISPI